MQLRPSEWEVVFALIEDMSKVWNWVQDDPSHATVQEVIDEFIVARTILEKGPSMYIGEVREFAIADSPEGWLRCDGATYANVDYPLLAAVIHAGFVVDADNFRVPDRGQRVGVDGFTVASQGGEANHTMTVAELVSHRHAQDQFGTAASVVLGTEPGFEIAPEAGYTDYEGGGEAFNVRDPYEGTQFYIRAAWPTAG